jgi:Ca2+/H+ antiporter, TMEM165/GDT1 family
VPGAGNIGLVASTFIASAVEFVEALTIVLAIGVTRGWRSALWGVGVAVAALAVITAVAGYALVQWFPRTSLELVVGMLLLIFGLQWLRKAILRTVGLKALHDEELAYAEERAAARTADEESRYGLDWYAFVISFKGVFLEGLEVIFIVITFGVNAGSIALAAAAAAAAAVIVVAAGVVAHRPLSTVPENTLKFVVGLALSTFGTFWVVEGLGVFAPDGQPLEWPGGSWALPVLFLLWLATAWATVLVLRRAASRPAVPA